MRTKLPPPRVIYTIVTFVTLLLLVGLWLERPSAPWAILAYHLLPIALLWAGAWLFAQRSVLLSELARREQDLENRVAARTAELASSEERFRKLFHTTPAGILVGRLSDLRIVDANDAYTQMSGFAREDLVGRTTIELGILSLETHRALMARIRESGPPRDFELKVRNKAGEPVEVLYSSEVIELDGETCFLAAVHDISEHKRLAARADRLAAIVEAANDAIASFDLDGTILTVNRSTEELYQISAAAVIGQNLFRLVPPEYAEPLQATLADIRRGELLRLEDAAWPLPDGGTMFLSLTLSPIYDDHGKVTAVTSIARDVTTRKCAEEALQRLNAELEDRVIRRTADLESALTDLQRANRLKDEFMAMISHELRTPLTGVLTMAELLADGVGGPLNARQGGYVKGINESGERLLRVINGILSYTHLLSGSFQLHRENCDLSALLDICARSQRSMISAKAQTVSVQVEPPNLAIVSDATAIAEVLTRLLDNASRYTPAGGRIGLDAHCGSHADTVDLVVWDNGSGIAPDQLANILKPFTQADGSLTRRHEGVGLGLAYVEQMVHLLGGTLAVASEVGAGSRFTISLPLTTLS